MQQATVFNIQKFSLNDGPGIRTVVFLKGCPLRCAWCANPEGQDRRPQMEWNARACVGCGACLAAVGSAVPAVERDGKRHVDVRQLVGSSSESSRTLEGGCTLVGGCAAVGGRAAVGSCAVADSRSVDLAQKAIEACPQGALTMVGETKTVEEVARVCLQDLPFYEDSGGGVTLSGGEALTWPDFCIELADRLHEDGVDVCVETEAYVDPATFDRVTAHLDRLLIDLKHVNSREHRLGTGVGNELILENIGRAVRSGKDVLVRTPVVPGFNVDVADARAMARQLRELGVARVQLLPFHNFGESKYDMLDMPYSLHGQKNLSADDLREYAQAYADEGVEAFF